MIRGFLKSSPHFFRLIRTAAACLILLLLALGALVPAPLQGPADLARVPNPVKSAWFLLWIQELVSYSKYLIYPVLALAGAAVLLPWLAPGKSEGAGWLQREHRLAGWGALLVAAAITLLTGVAFFLRGENWAFVPPF